MLYKTIHSSKSKQHFFSRKQQPLLTVESGDEISFDNRNAGFHLVNEQTTDHDMAEMEIQGLEDMERVFGPIYVDGPVFVKDALPGDRLQVEILELETGPWGWTAIMPGLGLLQDEMPGPHIKTFSLKDGFAVFKAGIKIPSQPFYGTMGVAPAEDTQLHPLFPRNDIGGNFDCRDLGVGSKFFLPINVEGALFSVGDAHFCQGDGEITGTALETTMKSRLRLTVIKGKTALCSPHFQSSKESRQLMRSMSDPGRVWSTCYSIYSR